MKRIGRGVSLCVAVLLMLGTKGMAGEPNVGVVMDAPILSAYVWRGQVLNDEAVFAPSLTVVKGGFSLNMWGNVNLTDAASRESPEYTEIDVTPSYARKQVVGSIKLSYTF